MTEPIVVWQLTDGKPGHEQQTLGLIRAMERLIPLQTIRIDLQQQPVGVMDLLLRRFPHDYPQPALILGAGHGTHIALLAARLATGGRAVVLMRPSLPLAWFDYVIMPQHDNPPPHPHVMGTYGVLNPVRPAVALRADRGLMLLGGPSKRHGWDEEAIVRQMQAVLAAQPQVQWQISTSRRTPEHTFLEIRNIAPNAQVWSSSETPPGWVEQQLQEAGQVWVSEDSVSMIFESMTAGGQVGLLQPPRLVSDRITQALDQLLVQRWLTSFEAWEKSGVLQRAPRFCEADRAADWLLRCEGLWPTA